MARLQALWRSKPDDPVLCWHIGSLLAQAGRKREAAELMGAAWDGGRHKKAAFRIGVALGLARLAQSTDADEAERWSHAALALHLGVPEAWCLLGDVAADRGEPDQAKQAWTAGMLVRSMLVELAAPVRYHTWYPRWRLGRAALARGRFDTAARWFAEVLRYELPDEVALELQPWAHLVTAGRAS